MAEGRTTWPAQVHNTSVNTVMRLRTLSILVGEDSSLHKENVE